MSSNRLDEVKINLKEESTSVKENNSTKSKEELYETNKAQGNEHVKHGNFEKAIEFYTKCIEIDSENPLAYSNRSLCYIKCNKADLALKDSNFVLKKDKTNVKCLFRRAVAYKMKLNYDLAIEDLDMLVKLEKNNQIAIQELEEIKKMKKAKSLETHKKIVVLDDEPVVVNDERDHEAQLEQSTVVEETKNTVKINQTSQTQAPFIRRTTFGKVTNAYEFLQLWNSINPQDMNSFARLLLNVQAVDLPKFIGSKLDDNMLTTLLRATQELIQDKELYQMLNEEKNPLSYLKYIAKSQRFNVIKLFLNQEQKQTLNKILTNLKNVKNEDINLIKKEYCL